MSVGVSFTDSVLEADLERCQKEVNQLKVDHEVAMEKKDREVQALSPFFPPPSLPNILPSLSPSFNLRFCS